MNGAIFLVGLGPGAPLWMAPGAALALAEADVIVGYQTYLEQIKHLYTHIPRESSGMRHEIRRARRAVELAQGGQKVAVVSGGDSGIYGMAGLIFEILEAQLAGGLITVEVLPGITALTAAAALLGAPLMSDFAAISLSDYLVPFDTILKRLDAAIQGDFVICLYNPRSRQRCQPFETVYQKLLLSLGGDRPVGLVRAAYRAEQRLFCGRLIDLTNTEVGMDCILIVGSSATRILNGKMVTSRGYKLENERVTGGV
ncbi:MAG: precorrin-3B C(17)-methyltransferase [Anaerolineae bacterium]|nr:precorrin-3B C(17)-methyltransferase [Anaerolineae bacterium]